MAALGFLVAALALLLTLLGTRTNGGGKKALLGAAGIVSLGFIAVIAAPLFRLGWAQHYFRPIMLSLLPVLLVVFFTGTYVVIEPRAWWALFFGFAGSWVAIIAPFSPARHDGSGISLYHHFSAQAFRSALV